MNTVLTISDSVQGTLYDLIRCTATIKEYGLDPLSIVPRIAYDDGTSEESDVSEMLDYAFGQCDFSVLAMGFITEPEVILYAADKLDKNKTAPVIACPSIISDEGEVLVGGEVYSALCDRLLHYADFIIVNPFEAEAFCGFECPAKNDYLRAAKKIYNVYGCSVLIRGNDKTDWHNVLFNGTKPVWINPVSCEPGFEDKYSLLAALACEFAVGNPASLAVPLALDLAEAVINRSSAEASINRTPVPEFHFGSSMSKIPAAETPHIEEKPIVTSSLVTPGKSIRDIARVITPAVNPDEVKHAVTSNIEKPEEPKGEITSLANSRFLFDSKVNDSITSLQSLKDRLNNLNKLADSGK